MGQRKAVTREMANRYRRASKPQKAAMLDQFVKLHGCTRHHAGWVLRMWGKTVFERRDGELVKIVVGQRRPRRQSRRIYDDLRGGSRCFRSRKAAVFMNSWSDQMLFHARDIDLRAMSVNAFRVNRYAVMKNDGQESLFSIQGAECIISVARNIERRRLARKDASFVYECE